MDSRLLSFFLKISRVYHPRILPVFGSLKKSLAKANITSGFMVYLGLMAFTSLAAGSASLLASYILFSSFGIQIVNPLILSILTGLIVAVLSVGIYLSYPRLVIYSRGNKIDSNLPVIANFLSVLASSGMTPEGIFRSLARVGNEFGVAKEIKCIIRDIDLLGLDLHAALKKASENSPSKRFGSLIDGIVATSHMGGDLAAYLREQAENYKKMRLVKMKSFLDNLSVISEVYITFMVAAPLMMIVMLSVMSFLGGGVTFGNLDPRVLLDLLTFVITPVGVLIMILAVDSITPQR